VSVELDHTIVCTMDRPASIAFYTEILGFEHLGPSGQFEVILVNDHLGLDLVQAERCSSRHFAFVMDPGEFEAAFARIRNSGIPFGDGPSRATNMRGPGRSTGTRGATYSVYFSDPSGHLLEILTY
jgi:catechol 2,3-dioxygenase-like lactoylglutathione lyase family enzyme